MQHLTSMEGFRAPYDSPATSIVTIRLRGRLLQTSTESIPELDRTEFYDLW